MRGCIEVIIASAGVDRGRHGNEPLVMRDGFHFARYIVNFKAGRVSTYQHTNCRIMKQSTTWYGFLYSNTPINKLRDLEYMQWGISMC